MDGAVLTAPSGFLSTVVEAMQTIYNPQEANERRKEASSYLDTLRMLPDVQLTLQIASEAAAEGQPPEIRYFGLSILKSVISHRLRELVYPGQTTKVRDGIVRKAQNVNDRDPPYIRNMIAELWLEMLKQTWTIDWNDMDKDLVGLWNCSLVHKDMVLTILKMGAEELLSTDDLSLGDNRLRDEELSREFVQLLTPASALPGYYPDRHINPHLRCGQGGWLVRMRDFLIECVNQSPSNGAMRSSAMRTLDTLSAVLFWIPPKAITEWHLVDVLLQILTISYSPYRLACFKALVAIYNRSGLPEDIHAELLRLLLRPSTIRMLMDIYLSLIADILDEVTYDVCKMLVEFISCVSDSLAKFLGVLHDDCDFDMFCTLCLHVLQHPSLSISTLVLRTWVKMLNSPALADSFNADRGNNMEQLFAPLLFVASVRLFKFETLPEDHNDRIVFLLNKDFDTIPERHVFLGNYRRLCVALIESIVRLKPYEAIPHILRQSLDVFKSVHDEEPLLRDDHFTKLAPATLRIDAQCTVVAVAVKGLVQARPSDGKPQDQDHEGLLETLALWLGQVLQFDFRDPTITGVLVHIAAECSLRALNKNSIWPIRVVEKILSLHTTEHANFPQYNDAVQELEGTCVTELRSLALRFPDYLMVHYDKIRIRIDQILGQGVANDRTPILYKSFLFVILHRSLGREETGRQEQMQEMLRPVQEAWQDQHLQSSLSSFESFCGLLGMGHLPAIFGFFRADPLSDWPSIPLDERGKQLQANISRSLEQLPLRATHVFLDASTQSLPTDPGPLQVAQRLWGGAIPIILPHLLQLVKFTHAFYNLESWGQLSASMRQVFNRVFTDRFWQAGISTEPKNIFYAKINASKGTLEGFGSTVRATVREVRESAYGAIVGLSTFGETFYGIDGLTNALVSALFDDSEHLPPVYNAQLLNFTQSLLHRCPHTLRQQFVPPIVENLFAKMELKIRMMVEEIKARTAEDDDLEEEMQKESLLRTLLYGAVTFVASLVGLSVSNGARKKDPVPLSNFILSATESVDHQRMLERILWFCTFAVRIQDTRSCMALTQIFRTLIPRFSSATPTASYFRELISKNVLMACVDSLHDPYFVDMQKELASVIAAIITAYSPKTPTPRQVIWHLPGMTAEQVDRAFTRICEPSSQRRLKGLVLELLESVRGVRIGEEGWTQKKPDAALVKTEVEKHARRSARKIAKVDKRRSREEREPSPEMEGLVDMFVSLA